MQRGFGLVIIGIGLGYMLATAVYTMPSSKPDIRMDLAITNHCGWIPDEIEYKQIWDNCVAEVIVMGGK